MGRLWYAGIGSGKLSSNVYFSQVVNNRNRYGKCYQKYDPTSEFYSILLPDDGGVINIPEIGVINKLFALKTALLVFSSNGVWAISGSYGRAFAANDYQVKKFSSLGSSSPLSFVDYKGYPMWFGEDGIHTIYFDPQFETYEIRSLSDETIKTFFLDIPSTNRQYVKGSYNINDDVVLWVYNSDTTFTNTKRYKYNKVLCYSGRNQAFYPWSFDDVTSSVDIRGVSYIFDSNNTDRAVVKFPITVPNDASNDYLCYADDQSGLFYDWTTYANDVASDTDEIIDYSDTCYFITGYRPDGDTQRGVQSDYVFVFFENVDNSSCKMQGIYDYSSSSASGKQSSFQECYFTGRDNRDIVYRKLRVRGHGRCLQLKFKATGGQPFTMIGWSTLTSTQGDT